jgi:hypothetical protein
MGNILMNWVQQTFQKLYLPKPLSSEEVIKCGIELLSEDVIQQLVDLLSHRDALSLNQTCKLLHKYALHKCHPKIGQIIQQQPNLHQCSLNDLPMDLIRLIALCSDYVTGLSVKYICKKFYKGINIPSCSQLDYDERFKKDELAQERQLLLHEISLTCGSLNGILECYPKLECLLIDYSCKWDDCVLNFEEYSGLWRIFINLNVSNLPNMGESSNLLNIRGSSTMEHLTFHISWIDPVTSKIIPDMHEKEISLFLDNFLNFNCW